MAAIGKLRTVQSGYMAWCNGCKEYHVFDLRWTFSGDYENPTFNPSMLVDKDNPERRCHSFLIDGVWHYLGDCHHELANTESPLIAFKGDEE